MEPIGDVFWPRTLLNYTVGVSSEVVRAVPDENLTSDSIVPTTPIDLVFCKPIAAVPTYRKLLQVISKLAAVNPRYELFFRGERRLHPLSASCPCHSVQPSLLRSRSSKPIAQRIEELNRKAESLRKSAAVSSMPAYQAMRMKSDNPLARWAVLEHYGICDTPFINLTRSLTVACSFALNKADDHAYILVLGMPYQSQKVTYGASEGIINLSLLGLTPSNAMRPLIQEGFVACDADWWQLVDRGGGAHALPDEYDVDFSCRIMAVLKIPTAASFWSDGMSALGPENLYPEDDEFLNAIKEIG